MQEYGFPLDRIFWYKYKIYDSALIMENMGQQKSEILVYFTQCVLIITQQLFNDVSALSFGSYDAATWDNVKSTLKQRCVF